MQSHHVTRVSCMRHTCCHQVVTVVTTSTDTQTQNDASFTLSHHAVQRTYVVPFTRGVARGGVSSAKRTYFFQKAHKTPENLSTQILQFSPDMVPSAPPKPKILATPLFTPDVVSSTPSLNSPRHHRRRNPRPGKHVPQTLWQGTQYREYPSVQAPKVGHLPLCQRLNILYTSKVIGIFHLVIITVLQFNN